MGQRSLEEEEERRVLGPLLDGEWELRRVLGQGSFGRVWEAWSVVHGERCAVKSEAGCRDPLLWVEVKVLRRLNRHDAMHAARLLGSGHLGGRSGWRWMAMTLLGPTLSQLRLRTSNANRCFSTSTTLRLLQQGIQALQELHATSFVHRDLKPSNLTMGAPASDKARTLILIDFGLCRRWERKDGGGTRRQRLACPFRGSFRYASANAHLQLEVGRQDDLWSLLYVLLDLHGTPLPWFALRNTHHDHFARLKLNITPTELLPGLPHSLRLIPLHLQSQSFQDSPDYALLCSILDDSLRRHGIASHDPFDWEPQPPRIIRSLRRSLRSLRSSVSRPRSLSAPPTPTAPSTPTIP